MFPGTFHWQHLTCFGSQGIHNLFIVIPQFISSGLVSLIFALFDPAKTVQHKRSISPGQSQIESAWTGNSRSDLTQLNVRQAEEVTEAGGGSAIAIIFRCVSRLCVLVSSFILMFSRTSRTHRIGGVSAIIAFFICFKLARELRRKTR